MPARCNAMDSTSNPVQIQRAQFLRKHHGRKDAGRASAIWRELAVSTWGQMGLAVDKSQSIILLSEIWRFLIDTVQHNIVWAPCYYSLDITTE